MRVFLCPFWERGFDGNQKETNQLLGVPLFRDNPKYWAAEASVTNYLKHDFSVRMFWCRFTSESFMMFMLHQYPKNAGSTCKLPREWAVLATSEVMSVTCHLGQSSLRKEMWCQDVSEGGRATHSHHFASQSCKLPGLA